MSEKPLGAELGEPFMFNQLLCLFTGQRTNTFSAGLFVTFLEWNSNSVNVFVEDMRYQGNARLGMSLNLGQVLHSVQRHSGF